MPGNRRLTKKNIKGKEGLHPGSRKASQLARVQLRHHKLAGAAKLRKGSYTSKLDRPTFFVHALTSPHPLSLPSLRALISTVYLTRHDDRIQELDSERRAGRPKAKEQLELEEQRRREHAEWETGIEVPDLTHPATVKLLYGVLESEGNLQHSHVDLIKQIRLFKNSPEEIVISKPGKTEKMGLLDGTEGIEDGEDWTNGQAEEGTMQVE